MIRDTAKTSRDIADAYAAGLYIVTYRTVYKPYHSPDTGHYARRIYHHTGGVPLVGRGRFCHMTAEAVSQMIGIAL